MPAELTAGSRINMRIEIDDDARLTRASFTCPCGWSTTSSGDHLVVPEAVRAHRRVCPYAAADQLTLEDAIGGAP